MISILVPSRRSSISAIALAAGFCLQPQLEAASRSSALNVSITIVDACSVQSLPSLATEDFERLFSTGQTSGAVVVRCSQATPFQVRWAGTVTNQGEAPLAGPSYPTKLDPLRLQHMLVSEPALNSADTPSGLTIPLLPADPGISAIASVEPKPLFSLPPMIIVTF